MEMKLSTLKIITLKEWGISSAAALALFVTMGTVTALWNNSYFSRMTPVSEWDFVILSLESLLLGFFLGIRKPDYAYKEAGVGGVFGFLGFGCSICNQILVMLFGSSFLLYYFEPIRYYVGALGIALLAYALYQKLLSRFEEDSEDALVYETEEAMPSNS